MNEREKIAMDIMRDTLKKCKETYPERFQDAPDVTPYNIKEIYQFLSEE